MRSLSTIYEGGEGGGYLMCQWKFPTENKYKANLLPNAAPVALERTQESVMREVDHSSLKVIDVSTAKNGRKEHACDIQRIATSFGRVFDYASFLDIAAC